MSNHHLVRASSWLVLSVLAFAACGSDDPTRPPLPEVATLELEAPLSARTGRAFRITVTARDGSGTIESAFFGDAILSVSTGTVSPTNLSIQAGSGTAEVTLAAATGVVTLTVRADGHEAQARLDPVVMGALEGDPTAAAAPAIPLLEYVPDAAGFSTDRPDLPGMAISFDQVLVSLDPAATVQQVNDALVAVDGTILGGVGGPDGSAGILVMKLPATSHAEATPLLAMLEAAPGIGHVAPDVLLGPDLVTESNGGAAPQPDWTWEVDPQGGNWGMEYVRAPQMWNLNSAVDKAGAPYIETVVIDAGFAAGHPDITFQFLSTNGSSDHGMHVAGTIGATFGNGVGVDGINPYATIVALGPKFLPGPTLFETKASIGNKMMVMAYLASVDGADVINTSLGYTWKKSGIDPVTSAAAQAIASAQGAILADMLATLGASGAEVPLIVTSAGNDSKLGQAPIPAPWNSPMANAALEHGAPDIVVVEAVSLPAAGSPAQRAYFSNVGGTVAAPGVAIWSLSDVAPFYKALGGTSMATPHVTGLVGYLLELAPELTNAQIRQILSRNTQATSDGAAPAVDAFASALNVDWALGEMRVLRALLDIDDGTEDGNQRLDASGSAVPGGDLDTDGGIGDGLLDMSDFRHWRDALLQIEDAASLALDGPVNDPKRDLNGDGHVGTAAEEAVYPVGDFNGDGRIDRTGTAWVPGLVDAQLTDLQVLQQLFTDPDVPATDLDGLMDSGDVTVDASDAFAANPTAVRAVVQALVSSTGDPVAQRDHLPADDSEVRIYTLPVETYTFTIHLYDVDDVEISNEEIDVIVLPGSDDFWKPTAELPPVQLALVAEWTQKTTWDGPVNVLVAASYVSDGEIQGPAEGATVTLSATGGSLATTSGVTDAYGNFETNGGLTFPADEMIVTVVVTTLDGLTDELVLVTTRERGVVSAARWGTSTFSVVAIAVGETFYDPPCRDELAWEADPTASVSLSLSYTASCTLAGNSASASGSLDIAIETDPAGGLAAIIASGSGDASGGGAVGFDVIIEFDVSQNVVHRRIYGEIQATSDTGIGVFESGSGLFGGYEPMSVDDATFLGEGPQHLRLRLNAQSGGEPGSFYLEYRLTG